MAARVGSGGLEHVEEMALSVNSANNINQQQMAARAGSGGLEHVEEMALSVNSANNITNSTADGSKGRFRLPGTRGGDGTFS